MAKSIVVQLTLLSSNIYGLKSFHPQVLKYKKKRKKNYYICVFQLVQLVKLLMIKNNQIIKQTSYVQILMHFLKKRKEKEIDIFLKNKYK